MFEQLLGNNTFLIAAVLAVLAYVNRDQWLPLLSKLRLPQLPPTSSCALDLTSISTLHEALVSAGVAPEECKRICLEAATALLSKHEHSCHSSTIQTP